MLGSWSVAPRRLAPNFILELDRSLNGRQGEIAIARHHTPKTFPDIGMPVFLFPGSHTKRSRLSHF